MFGFSSKSDGFEYRSAFEGFKEKDFIALYNLGELQSVAPGKALFKEGEQDPSLHLVLKGSLRLVKSADGTLRELGTLKPGEWVPEAFVCESILRTGSAVATEPSTVLTVSWPVFNSLDPELRTLILKRINDGTAARIQDLFERQETLRRRVEVLTAYIQRSHAERNRDYAQSEMIVGMLEKVPKLPMYASRLAQMLLDQNVSAKDVANLARNDPSIVSAVLKRVNSAYYNWQKKISDFQHAVILLGFNQVYQLVIADGMKKTMPDTPEFQELHEHSVVVSHLAGEICLLHHRRKASMMSTIALLHDIGKSMILLLKRQNPKLHVLIDMLDSGKIGAMLLAKWNIPDTVCLSLEYQHYPEFAPPARIPAETRETVALLHVAHLCVDHLKGSAETLERSPFAAEYLQLVKAGAASVRDLVALQLLPAMEKKFPSLPESVRKLMLSRGDAPAAAGP